MQTVEINMKNVFIITKHSSAHSNSIKQRMILPLEERFIGYLEKKIFLQQF